MSEEGTFYEQVEVDIEESDDTLYGIRMITTARGRTLKEARLKADDTQWNYSQQGNVLVMDPYFVLGKDGNWQAQHIKLKIRVPAGKYIHLDDSMEDILNWGRYSPYKLAGKTWIMTDNGLRDPEEEGFVSPTIHTETTVLSGGIIKPIVMRIVGFVW